MSTTTLMTVEQFDALPADEQAHYELSQGELIELPSASLLHNIVKDRTSRYFIEYLEREPVGLSATETDFVFGPETIRRPDLAFIRAERLGLFNYQGRPAHAPDLIVEFISPSESFEGVMQKVVDYQKGGVKFIWLVLLELRGATVWSGHKGQNLESDGILTCPELLPGLSIPIARLFHGL